MDYYLGEIRMFGGGYAPADWLECNGQLLNVSQYTTLFSLIGTTYGGDGVSTFALPNFQSRIPLHTGTGTGLTPVALGQTGGAETVVLTPANMPPHTHVMTGVNATGNANNPANAYLANSANNKSIYYPSNPAPPPSAMAAMGTNSVSNAGNAMYQDIIQPYVVINYIICTNGVYPTN